MQSILKILINENNEAVNCREERINLIIRALSKPSSNEQLVYKDRKQGFIWKKNYAEISQEETNN